ncbi:oligomeric complex COG6-domain-containing protein [Gymnopilus junonius]|uniref:Conserved oligomeric Golgi complex subunit 6 n=1 Tax=Gymnopilus junonius TaxID=109634 RepID=A0A9P5TPJ3_GYMJU|nr:oligomeric complex COG6-domain-containing protein [Gymnopilus junonius]
MASSTRSPSITTPRPSTPSQTDRKTSWTPQARFPASTRLYKVLSSNFDDEETRKEVQTVASEEAEDEFGVEGVDPSHHTAAAATAFIETVPGESATRARKNLRRDMEKRLAEGSKKFLDALGEVDARLLELQAHVAAMRASCDEAETQLTLTNESSKLLLERAGNLRDESESEVEAFTSREVPVGQRFFQAMDKTERIREDCRVLMSGEDGSTKLGWKLCSTSANLEQGYEKILRYLSNEFRQGGRDSQLEVSSQMREAVQRLRKRPELLTEALASLSETRQTTLLSSFIAALTRGGPSAILGPLNCTPMILCTIAAEREFLESLFGMKQDGRMVGSVRKFDFKKEEEEWLMRVQQTIRSQESSIIAYKIANLLQFYLMTMRRTLGDEALLSYTLKEMTDVAYKVFYDSIENQSQALSRRRRPVSRTSSSGLDHAQILREVMTVPSEVVAGFHQVLDIMVDPIVVMCIENGDAKRKARPRWDEAVFVLNCLCYLQSVLSPFEFTMKKQAEIQAFLDQRVVLLTNEHGHDLLKDAGLLQVAEACRSHKTGEPLSRIPGTQPTDLQEALHHFSIWLSGLEVVQSPRLAQLTVQRLHTKVHQDALARLVRTYKMICDEVKDPRNRYEAASTLLGSERPFGQVHLLWQVFGLEEEEETNEGENEEEDSDEGEDEEEDGDEGEDSDDMASDEEESEEESGDDNDKDGEHSGFSSEGVLDRNQYSSNGGSNDRARALLLSALCSSHFCLV